MEQLRALSSALLIGAVLCLAPACRSIARYSESPRDGTIADARREGPPNDFARFEAIPDAPIPDVAIPDVAIPDAAIPDAAIPDAAIPDATIPDSPKAISDGGSKEIGKPCLGDTGCASTLCVIPSGQSLGVCTIPCIPDDLSTPLVIEDSCPNLNNNVCGADPNSSGAHYCYRRCSPRLGGNDCAAGLACKPKASTMLGNQAICLLPACQSDFDCPVITSQGCSGGGGCAQCIDGRCAVAGKCDLASGLCALRTSTSTFSATAKVGDPCKADTECGAAMRCEREVVAAGLTDGAPCTKDSECCSSVCESSACKGKCRVHARNGYCTIVGCAYPSLTAFSCPTGSDCAHGYLGGWCMKSCLLDDAKTCRDNGADKLGDYECRAWQNISLATQKVSNGPICEFGDNLPCDRFASPALDCTAIGNTPNATVMACRDLSGAVLNDPKDPRGYCLDNTASGSIP